MSMSTEEEARIGRLVVEQNQVSRQRGALEQEIKKYSKAIDSLPSDLSRVDAPDRVARAIQIVDSLLSLGGLDHLKAILQEHEKLRERGGELANTIRDAVV